ncbi:MAG: tetratricopeptide repeat protein [Pseudomonadales bacterium]
MRITAIVLLLALFAGCQTSAPPIVPEEPYEVLAQRMSSGEAVAVAALRQAFVADPAFPAKLSRLTELESQALQLAEDEPLKLGSLGSAILDLYQGSLAGHYAMQRFYEHVENPETAVVHSGWVERIVEDIRGSGDGSIDAPYPAVTPIEPIAFTRSQGLLPVGSIYRTTEAHHFVLLLQSRPQTGALTSTHFDLDSVYQAIRSELVRADHSAADATADDEPDSVVDEFNPFALMVYLARQGDTAAQAAIGAYQATHDRQTDAIEWLRSASRSGNVLANNLLARVFFELAESAEDDTAREQAMDQVMENYVHAIALGSLDSAYALGVLYVNDHYGEDNAASGVPLLKQASAGGHAGATLYLGHLSYQGKQMQQSYEEAGTFYLQAAQTDSTTAKKTYARFLLDRNHALQSHPDTVDWLRTMAKEGADPEAMLLLGNLHARGLGTAQNFRRARSWFEKAIKASDSDANIVNEVAWVLTVSHLDGLKRTDYALDIMTTLMDGNDAARQRPEYLDTWAATFAANGEFTRAIEIQKEALGRAEETNDPDVIKELQIHLEQFEAGETITETAP